VSQEQTKLRKLKIIDKKTTIHTSKNTIRLILIHHRQNPTEINYMVTEPLCISTILITGHNPELFHPPDKEGRHVYNEQAVVDSQQRELGIMLQSFTMREVLYYETDTNAQELYESPRTAVCIGIGVKGTYK
jgi:hypothetical protein